MSLNKVKKHDFNFKIVNYFFHNTRLTILSIIFFVFVGVFATLALNITGFPNPDVNIAVVQTPYIGADVETVNKEVTIPIEGAIKNLDGVENFNSTSRNSFSNIVVVFDESIDLDIAKSRLDSAIKSVDLPDDAETPSLFSPSVGGTDAILVVFDDDEEKLFNTKTELTKELNTIPTLSEVTELVPFEKQVVVRVDESKLSEFEISLSDVASKISTIGESIPVASDVTIDNLNSAITTSVKGGDYQTLLNLSFDKNDGGQIALKDLASVQTQFNYEGGTTPYFGIRKDDGQRLLSSSVVLNLKAVDGADQNELIDDVKKEINNLEGDIILSDDKNALDKIEQGKTNINIAFTAADSNNEQINEVLAGLIGSRIEGLGVFGYAGFALGGIWLVMIVMIAMVSWRAAIISALSIPLSFLFSTLFLFLTGESLNTLTLFSLVLVTGLVVDPTLVVLEAIQRKIDAGYKGLQAGLKAIDDVGMGIFLAMVTNIIVFAPFGVLSGIFGQIFRYIPYTIVPAVIGSYIVPVVVLTWFGSRFLKRNKNANGTEEDNLWSVSKLLIQLNQWILELNRYIRFAIIVVAVVIPVAVTVLLFNNGSVKNVQFASVDDVSILTLDGTFLNVLSQENRESARNDVLQRIIDVPEVEVLFADGDGLEYYIYLEDKEDRDRTSGEIVEELNRELSFLYGVDAEDKDRKFFDIKVSEEQNAGGGDSYQTSIAIQTEDLSKLKTSAISVGSLIKSQACVKGNEIVLDGACDEEDKLVDLVDDGFSYRENFVYDIQLDREFLLSNNLAALGRGPISSSVNQAIGSRLVINRGEEVATVEIDGNSTDVILEPLNKFDSVEDLENTLNNLSQGQEGIGEIVQTTPAQAIRRQDGETTSVVNVRLKDEYADNQGFVSGLTEAVVEYYSKDDYKETLALGLEKNAIGEFSAGESAGAAKAFTELGIALLLAIILSYIVLAIFFNSFLQPLTILYTVPITFIGVFPALAYFAGGQFGFLEIIGLIILIGIVENVAIFLIDGAKQKINEGWDLKRSISYMSGVRLKPVVMTTLTTTASLLPLAIFSEFYRTISTVILGGLLASGFISLITTPILFIFFNWLSDVYRSAKWFNKILFFPLFPIYILVWSITRLHPVHIEKDETIEALDDFIDHEDKEVNLLVSKKKPETKFKVKKKKKKNIKK